MSENSENPSDSESKKFDFSNFIPEKSPASTSLGTLYVRHINISDWGKLNVNDSEEIGRCAITLLTSRTEEKLDKAPLSDEDSAALTSDDVSTLALAICEKCAWEGNPTTYVELGEIINKKKAEAAQKQKEIFSKINSTIEGSYGFLAKDSLKNLQEQVKGLSSIRSLISSVENIKSTVINPHIYEPSIVDRLRSTQSPSETLRRASSADSFFARDTSPSIDVPRMPQIPLPENTALGRAALENAQNSREAVERMDRLVEVIGGLNQALVIEVLPAWFKKVEDDQKQAEQTVIQAGRSLSWTKWAVIASVVVAVLSTALQTWITFNLDSSNSATQKETMAILRDQLSSQSKLLEQQNLEAKRMQSFIEQQARDAEMLRALIEDKLSSPKP
ncbi:MAG: hypothetical protein AB7U71_02770 [Comamonas sp.]